MGKILERFIREHRSLYVKVPRIFVISGCLIVLTITPFIIYRFRNRMVDEYTRMAKGVTNLMVCAINGDHVEDYIEQNFASQEYQDILKKFYDIRDSYPEIVYLYVFRMKPDGGHVVFDLDTENGEGDPPGSVYQLDADFLPYLDELCAGHEIPVLLEHAKEGYLLTYVKPVFDSQGQYQCHVCVDFSMDYQYNQDRKFVISILAIMGIVIGIILLYDISLIRRKITNPLNKMSTYIKEFTYETEEDRYRNVQIMEELNISTHDEIEDLYREFVSVMKESLFYMTSFKRAKNDIKDRDNKLDQISEKAYKDALTNVGNPTAFQKAADQLNKEIQEGKAEFAIVMADVNNLKFVNDTFGHEAGDQYIRGCCSIICSIYKHSPVFRMGGDEFIVILKKEDYASRLLRLTKIREAFVGAYSRVDKDEWERFSASIGMAEFQKSDENVEQVRKRADEAMYEEKMKFKKKYGSYR